MRASEYSNKSEHDRSPSTIWYRLQKLRSVYFDAQLFMKTRRRIIPFYSNNRAFQKQAKFRQLVSIVKKRDDIWLF